MADREDIIKRLAMALPGWGDAATTAAKMRRRWAKATPSLQGVYRGAAEEIIRDARKLGLVVSLASPRKVKRKAPRNSARRAR